MGRGLQNDCKGGGKMKILKIVPMFRRNKEVEAYIPHLTGFTADEELEILRRVERAIPRKMWAFVENSIPGDYQGVLVAQQSPKERYRILREARKDVIGYNLRVLMGVKEILEQCGAVAVDTRYDQFTQIMALMSVYSSDSTKSVALSVNTIEEFNKWLGEGFDYFIGDFYTKAVISDTRLISHINPIKINQVALLAEVSSWQDGDADQDLRRMASIIERDVALTLNIIKLSNSSAFGGTRQINDVHGAIVRVGTQNLKHWAISYLATAVTDQKTPEIARVALLRGKFMENLAGHDKKSKWMAFFTGLCSVAGIMLGVSQEQALDEMHAPLEVREALEYQGQMGNLYGIAESYMNGDSQQLLNYLVGTNMADTLYISYLNAEMWVADLLGQMEPPK